MKKFNIYITRKIPQCGLDLLKRACGGYRINPHNRAMSKAELIRQLRGRDGALCLLTDQIDREVIAACGPRMKIFSNYAVGYENIDIEEASRRKIMITNTPGVLTLATAELAWSLLLSVSRNIAVADRFTRQRKFKGWDPLLFLGQDISGKTLGVVGAGRIGTAFALLSQGFKMNVLYHSHSRNEVLERELRAKKVTLKELLKNSDFVSLHPNLTKETFHLIGDKELALMKPTAFLINTSRGKAVDEKALVQTLKEKRIAGAGLDVYEEEPKIHPGLFKLPNVILAPHIGSATKETRERMAILAAKNLVQGLQGLRPKHWVNPEAFS